MNWSETENDAENGPQENRGGVRQDNDLSPFDVVAPPQITSGLVFSSPHSGSFYPEDFRAQTQLDELTLRRSEDAHVDALFGCAASLGRPCCARVFRAPISI